MRRGPFAAGLAAGLSAAAARAGAQPLTELRLAGNAADDATPVLWAKQKGLFERAGLSVTLEKFSSGSAVTAGVVGGSIDVGKSSLLPLISARSRGIPLQIVVPGELWLSDEPISGMVALNGAPIASGKDLNGKTLPAAGLRDLLEVATRAWVDATGGDARTLRFVEIPSSAVLGALTEGRIAAATLSTPYLGTALASGKVKLIGRPEDAIAKRFMITAWFATEAYIGKNRDALGRFARVVQDAAAYTNAHHAETVAVTAPFWGVDPKVLASMNRAFVPSTVDPRDLQPLVDAAVRYGVIEKPLDVGELISPVALRAR